MRGGYERGSIITTDDGTEWAIIGRLKQDDLQTEGKLVTRPSYAALKLHCMKANVDLSERSASEALRGFMCKFPIMGRSLTMHKLAVRKPIQPFSLTSSRHIALSATIQWSRRSHQSFWDLRCRCKSSQASCQAGFLSSLYGKGLPGFPSAIQPDKQLDIGTSLNASAKKSEKRLKKPSSKLAFLSGS